MLSAILTLVYYSHRLLFPSSIIDQRLTFFGVSWDGNYLIENHLKHFQCICGIDTFSQITDKPVQILQS